MSLLPALVACEMRFIIEEVLARQTEVLVVLIDHVSPKGVIPHEAATLIAAAHALLIPLQMIRDTYLFIQMADYFTRRTDQCH
jgi:hypothetical protein